MPSHNLNASVLRTVNRAIGGCCVVTMRPQCAWLYFVCRAICKAPAKRLQSACKALAKRLQSACETGSSATNEVTIAMETKDTLACVAPDNEQVQRARHHNTGRQRCVVCRGCVIFCVVLLGMLYSISHSARRILSEPSHCGRSCVGHPNLRESAGLSSALPHRPLRADRLLQHDSYQRCLRRLCAT